MPNLPATSAGRSCEFSLMTSQHVTRCEVRRDVGVWLCASARRTTDRVSRLTRSSRWLPRAVSRPCLPELWDHRLRLSDAAIQRRRLDCPGGCAPRGSALSATTGQRVAGAVMASRGFSQGWIRSIERSFRNAAEGKENTMLVEKVRPVPSRHRYRPGCKAQTDYRNRQLYRPSTRMTSISTASTRPRSTWMYWPSSLTGHRASTLT